MRIAALIGESASGKTEIGKAIYYGLSSGQIFHGWTFGTLHSRERIAVLGRYDDPKHPVFGGTDLFDPFHQPWQTKEFLRTNERTLHCWGVLIEGNQVCSSSFLKRGLPRTADLRIFIATVSNEERLRRHEIRGTGKEPDVEGRVQFQREQLDRISRHFGKQVEWLTNECPECVTSNAAKILTYLKGTP
jgi:hypothetical protein